MSSSISYTSPRDLYKCQATVSVANHITKVQRLIIQHERGAIDK
jgi:hypothetical protein